MFQRVLLHGFISSIMKISALIIPFLTFGVNSAHAMQVKVTKKMTKVITKTVKAPKAPKTKAPKATKAPKVPKSVETQNPTAPEVPADAPSDMPTVLASESEYPSSIPSESPSQIPSLSGSPSNNPSVSPSQMPSKPPSDSPSNNPSESPSQMPSKPPSDSPSQIPSNVPTGGPTVTPSASLEPSASSGPTVNPSVSFKPSAEGPSGIMTNSPTQTNAQGAKAPKGAKTPKGAKATKEPKNAKEAKATKLPKATKEPKSSELRTFLSNPNQVAQNRMNPIEKQFSFTFTFQLALALKLCDNTSDGGTNPDLLCADDDDRPLTRWSWQRSDGISETAESGFLKNSETNSYITSLNNDVQMVPEKDKLTWSIEFDIVGGIADRAIGVVLHPGQNFDLILCAQDNRIMQKFALADTPKFADGTTDFNNVLDECFIQTQIQI